MLRKQKPDLRYLVRLVRVYRSLTCVKTCTTGSDVPLGRRKTISSERVILGTVAGLCFEQGSPATSYFVQPVFETVSKMASIVTQRAVNSGIKSTLIGIVVNILLATVKGVAGVVGNSYALVADAIESASDVLSSLVIIAGLKLSSRPPDENHPYGHGKFEPLATVLVSCTLFGAAILISVESVHGIITPHKVPAPFTLLILALVIITKEWLFRYVAGVAESANSGAVRTDAWHHRSDAISSLAAFVGISIALFGGEEYACADDFAALIAALVISINAVILLKPAVAELIDTRPDPEIIDAVRSIAEKVPGVLGTHKCHVRKLGFDYFVDLDVLCDPALTIREGHDIAHDVGDVLHRELPQITRILVHVEPVDDYGRRSRG